MNIQVKRAFKSYSLFVTKKTIKKETGSSWIFLQFPLFCYPVNVLTPRSGSTKWWMNIVSITTTRISQRYILSYFYRVLWAFFLSIFSKFSLETVHLRMIGEIFQIYGVQITGKSICESKNWIYTFLYSCLPRKTLP